VTIRETFIRDVDENTDAAIDNLKSEKNAELQSLKDRNIDLETKLALAKIDFDEMEMKQEALVKQNTD
jgi:hypothetical protein